MLKPAAPFLIRRAAAELALLTAVGVFMGFLAPYGSDSQPLGLRLIYWLILIVGGGAIGIAFDVAVSRWLKGFWSRLMVDCVAMTPFVSLLVIVVAHAMYRATVSMPNYLDLLFQVFIICVLVMALRQLAWRAVWPEPAASRETVELSDAFRQRLSAKRREAKLLAVEAEDHYLRVHTDAGCELITARFGDALAELSGWPGFRTHRSWWVAACAIDGVRWSRGRGELRLTSGLVVPVSRSQAQALKTAGWR
jgi:DNA-binding LytR/AlgR family response regulator